jgi:ribosomal protein S18 acetylase RimI-like enzyme
MPEYIFAKTEEEYKAAAALFKEYAEWLNIDLGFQHFEEELLELHKMYAPPFGGIILCKEGMGWLGCIAIRKQADGIAELKRMYVRPAFQGAGIGKALLQEALKLAKKYKYEKIRLDTLNNMLPAIRLYEKNGFYQIPAYYHNPQATALFFEKDLLNFP